MADIVKFRRGQIWTYKIDPEKYAKKTPEENDFLIWRNRPWVIWGNDYRENVNLVTAIPLTHGLKFGIPISFGVSSKPGIAVVSQKRPILSKGFEKYVGCLNEWQMERLTEAIRFYDGDIPLPGWISDLMKDFILRVNFSDEPNISKQSIAIHWSLREWYDEQLRYVKLVDEDNKNSSTSNQLPNDTENDAVPNIPTASINVEKDLPREGSPITKSAVKPVTSVEAPSINNNFTQITTTQNDELPENKSDTIEISTLRLRKRYTKSPVINDLNIAKFIMKNNHNIIATVYGVSHSTASTMKRKAGDLLKKNPDLQPMDESPFIGMSIPEIEKASLDLKRVFVTLTRTQYTKIPLSAKAFQTLYEKFIQEFDEANKRSEIMGG